MSSHKFRVWLNNEYLPNHPEYSWINIPSLGWVRIKEKGYIPTTKDGYVIKSSWVSMKADRVYASVLVEISDSKRYDI